MTSSRLEAFSDGVLAIIITIMVLELKAPTVDSMEGLVAIIPNVLAYILSFVYVAIYWNNHHHLAKSIESVDSRILWANMLWLLSISFVPWSTAWVGHFYTSPLPVMVYSFSLFVTGNAYLILQRQITRINHKLEKEIGKDIKGKTSLLLYAIAVVVAPTLSYLSIILIFAVAVLWFIPDKRIEQTLKQK